MFNATARFLVPLLRLLFPARGCHRSAGALPATGYEDARTLMLPRVPAKQQGVLRGEDSALIRPYILTPEERQQRAQRGRRTSWPPAHGADAVPRWIHGVEVPV